MGVTMTVKDKQSLSLTRRSLLGGAADLYYDIGSESC